MCQDLTGILGLCGLCGKKEFWAVENRTMEIGIWNGILFNFVFGKGFKDTD